MNLGFFIPSLLLISAILPRCAKLDSYKENCYSMSVDSLAKIKTLIVGMSKIQVQESAKIKLLTDVYIDPDNKDIAKYFVSYEVLNQENFSLFRQIPDNIYLTFYNDTLINFNWTKKGGSAKISTYYNELFDNKMCIESIFNKSELNKKVGTRFFIEGDAKSIEIEVFDSRDHCNILHSLKRSLGLSKKLREKEKKIDLNDR